LDGFPRTVPQAEFLEKSGVRIDLVIEIDVADEEIIKRMSGRRVCPKCGATYHIEYKKSVRGLYCDRCNDEDVELTIRKDDSPEVVLSRLETYHKQTEPLKDFYESRGILRIVQGQDEVKDTSKLTFETIRKYFKNINQV